MALMVNRNPVKTLNYSHSMVAGGLARHIQDDSIYFTNLIGDACQKSFPRTS